MPFDTIVGSHSCLFALYLLDLSFLIRSKFMIPLLYRLSSAVPQFLGLSFLLFFEGPAQGRRGLRSKGIEEHFFVAGLLHTLVNMPRSRLNVASSP